MISHQIPPAAPKKATPPAQLINTSAMPAPEGQCYADSHSCQVWTRRMAPSSKERPQLSRIRRVDLKYLKSRLTYICRSHEFLCTTAPKPLWRSPIPNTLAENMRLMCPKKAHMMCCRHAGTLTDACKDEEPPPTLPECLGTKANVPEGLQELGPEPLLPVLRRTGIARLPL